MIKPIDAILFFYFLFAQRYMNQTKIEIKQISESSSTQANYTTKRLITNENIYDINETIEKVFIKGERNER